MDVGSALKRSILLGAWAIALVIAGGLAVAVHGDGRAPRAAATAASGAQDATTVATNAGDVVVAALHGDGSAPADTNIHVDGHWQLRWNVTGTPKIDVTANVDGRPLVVASFTTGDGSLDVDRGCDCTLHVEPNGAAYDLTVVDVAG